MSIFAAFISRIFSFVDLENDRYIYDPDGSMVSTLNCVITFKGSKGDRKFSFFYDDFLTKSHLEKLHSICLSRYSISTGWAKSNGPILNLNYLQTTTATFLHFGPTLA